MEILLWALGPVACFAVGVAIGYLLNSRHDELDPYRDMDPYNDP
jgi:uncharacterized protein YneF (UPF0154 family)